MVGLVVMTNISQSICDYEETGGLNEEFEAFSPAGIDDMLCVR